MTAPPASLVALLGKNRGTIAEVFDARVERTPQHPFLLWRDRCWSYADAYAQSRTVAAFFAEAARADRPRIAMYLGNCPEAMWTWFGSVFAGRVLVAINRKHRGALLADMLARSCASVLVTDTAALNDIPAISLQGFRTILLTDSAARGGRLHGADVVTFSQALGAAPFSPARCAPEEPACVMFTSGTTGRSKAVQVLHNQYVRGAARLVDGYGLRSADVFHNWLPLYHLAGQLHMTMTAVLCGGAVSLQPTFSKSRFWEEVHAHRCSVLCGFASILHFIWSLPPRADDSLSSLRVGIFAGIPVDLHHAFERRFGMSLGENYGMTEIDPVTCPVVGIEPPQGSCGRASPDVEIAILGPDGRQVGAGELGEIALRARAADILMGGYEDDPGATQEAMRDGWFHTGDYGVLDAEGFLYFKGRSSHYIRRRGENVCAAELEALMLRHPAVKECVAVGVPSEVGEEDIKLALVCQESAHVTPEQLHAFARANMADFMTPRYIELMPGLPRGELGKIELGGLRSVTPSTWDAYRS